MLNTSARSCSTNFAKMTWKHTVIPQGQMIRHTSANFLNFFPQACSHIQLQDSILKRWINLERVYIPRQLKRPAIKRYKTQKKTPIWSMRQGKLKTPVPIAEASSAKMDPLMAPWWMGENALWKKFLSFISQLSVVQPVLSVVSIPYSEVSCDELLDLLSIFTLNQQSDSNRYFMLDFKDAHLKYCAFKLMSFINNLIQNMQSEHQKINTKVSQHNKVIESRRYTNSDRTEGFIVGQEIYTIRDMPQQNAKISYEEITFRHNNANKVTEVQKAPTVPVNARRFSLANNNNQIDKSEERAKNNLLEESENYNRNLATLSHNQEVYGGKFAYLQTELSAFGAENASNFRRYDKRDKNYQQQGPIISSKNFASLDNSDQRVLTKLRERLLFQQVHGSKISNNARACSEKQLFVNRRQKLVSRTEETTKKISLKPKRLYMCPTDGYSMETNEIKRKKSKLWLCRKFQLKKWIQEDLTREEYKYCNLMKQMGGLSAISNINSDFGRRLKTNISNHSNTIDLNQRSYEDLVISNKKSSLGQIKQQKIKYNQKLNKLSHPKKDRAKSTLVVLADEPDNINQKISNILTRIRQKRKDLDSKDIIEQPEYSNSYLTVKLKTKSSSSLKQKNTPNKITPIREERLIKTEAMSVAAIDTSIKVYSNSQKSKQIKELMSRERPSVKINWHQMHVSK